MLASNGVVVSQETANAVRNFNIQAFQLAAVTWLVDNNIPLSQFEQPAFRSMIQFANPKVELALWTSHHSVSRFVMRLYDHMKPQVVELINSAISKIHISFDGWTTKGGKRSFFGVVAHFVDNKGSIKNVAIDLPQLSGAHLGDRIAVCVEKTQQSFGIKGPKLGYFVLDNATNNDTAVAALGSKYGFVAAHGLSLASSSANSSIPSFWMLQATFTTSCRQATAATWPKLEPVENISNHRPALSLLYPTFNHNHHNCCSHSGRPQA
jgi:hypothetical protein